MEPMKTILFLTTIIRISSQQQYGGCGGTFTQPSGSFSSPSYPSSYPDNQDCIYIIRAAPGRRVTLTFVTFQLEPGPTSGACHDYVQIREGDSVASPTLGTYCNTTVPPKVRSMANTLWVKFYSDSSVSKPGFQATYSTGIIPQKFLLMTNTYLHAIHRMDVDTGSNFVIPIDGLSNPIGIDYDPVDGRLYWTDVIEKTIRSANLDGSGVRLVRNLGPQAMPDGLAVDSASRLIFYTDAGNNIIAMIAISSYHHRVVVDSNLDEPRAIELDKLNGVMYWSDWGATPRIERANYDGTGRKTLVSGFQYLHWPNGLALDTVAGRLYWADGFADKIGWTDLEGTNVSVITFLPGRHMFGLDIYLNELFITDWGMKIVQPSTTSYIHRISADGKAVKTIGSVGGRLNDIHIYSEEMGLNELNGCGNNNGGCDYICIPAPGNTSQCLYPDGISPVVTTKAIATPSTNANTVTFDDVRFTTPVTSVTTTTTRATTTTNRPTSDVSTVLTAISRVTAGHTVVPDDVHTTTTGVHDVMSGVTNLSGGINTNHGSEPLGISTSIFIFIIGCVIYILTIASCATIILVVVKKKN
ncbi:low-density lipoprotein receptor-related protein 4-like isoform X2 [Pomacea canaliculata]|nr:low-density lipoprotein receptor-related protein 4-like isoform X2 [Pomacea canaliculata]